MNRILLTLFLSLGAAGSGLAQEVILPSTQPWSVLHITDGVDPATLDPSEDFADTWTTGTDYDGPVFEGPLAGPFRYGTINWMTANAPGATVLATPPTDLRFTSYFRTTFTVTEDYPEVFARMLADDGAILYLDGFEISRVNMLNSFGDEFTQFADNTVRTEDGVDTETATIDVSLGSLEAGEHTLAISLHNAGSASSDLGLYIELFGSAPPPPVMLVNTMGGTSEEIRVDGAPTGWQASPLRAGSWLMNGAASESTLISQPVDLSAAGSGYASLTLYVREESTGSNMEFSDFFSARLEVTYDDDSTGDLNMISDDDDLNFDGLLNGDEMNPPDALPEDLIYFARHLITAIPANVKSARLVITGLADSTSEFIHWGSARISGTDPLSDADGDGVPLQDELVAGTDPADPLSVFRAGDPSLGTDTLGNPGVILRGNTLAGFSYSVETGDDTATMESLGAYTPGTANGSVIVTFGTLPDRFFARLRPVP